MSPRYLARYITVMFLLISMVLLLLAPVIMPESYDWVRHTTSESGAQGVEGAWMARTGFVLYGLAVFLLVIYKKKWSQVTRFLHLVFALGMVGNAVFSSKPWLDGVPFDVIEDTLHSFMSGLVGTAFTLGVIVILFKRIKGECMSMLFDSFAVTVSVCVTFAMFTGSEDIAGLIQRVMFAVSYSWYVKEMLTIK